MMHPKAVLQAYRETNSKHCVTTSLPSFHINWAAVRLDLQKLGLPSPSGTT